MKSILNLLAQEIADDLQAATGEVGVKAEKMKV